MTAPAENPSTLPSSSALQSNAQPLMTGSDFWGALANNTSNPLGMVSHNASGANGANPPSAFAGSIVTGNNKLNNSNNDPNIGGSGRTITTFRGPPATSNPHPKLDTAAGLGLSSMALLNQLGCPFPGQNGGDVDIVAQVLQGIENAGNGDPNQGLFGSFPVPTDKGGGAGTGTGGAGAGTGRNASGPAYALRNGEKSQGSRRVAKEEDALGDSDGEDGSDVSGDGDDGDGGAGRRQGGTIGRPIAYTGDPSNPHLTDEERRRLKRRIANRESARRVRQKRQELMEELQQKCTALTQQNARLLAHMSSCDHQRQTLAAQVSLLRERFGAKISESNNMQIEIGALRKALQDKGVDVNEVLSANGALQQQQQAANNNNNNNNNNASQPFSHNMPQMHQQDMNPSAFAMPLPSMGMGMGLNAFPMGTGGQFGYGNLPPTTAAASAAAAAAMAAAAMLPIDSQGMPNQGMAQQAQQQQAQQQQFAMA